MARSQGSPNGLDAVATPQGSPVERPSINSISNGNFEAGDGSAIFVSIGCLDAVTQLNRTLVEIKRGLQDDPEEDDDSDKISGEKRSEVKGSEEDETDSEPTAGLDWQWQVQEEYKTKSGRVKLRKGDNGKNAKASDKTWIPFDVVYGLKGKWWPLRDYINVRSPLLMEIIGRLDPRLHYDASEGSFQVYAATLFQIREKLEEIGLNGVDPGNAQSSSEADRKSQQLHVRHLLRFMEKELKDVLTRYSAMEAGRSVSWDMLWAFFPPSTLVEYRCDITDEKLVGVVTDASYELEICHQEPHLHISIEVWDYDCGRWKAYNTSRSINAFDGERGFPTLQTCPLRFQDISKEDTTRKSPGLQRLRRC